MKLCVTGPNGNIGSVLVKRGAIPLDCDITKFDDVRKEVEKLSPDIIINTASKSSPTWCEENEEGAIAVNVRGAYWVALAAEEFNIPVVALSSDHVFSGSRGPYKETYRKLKPVNFYGDTKVGMEYLMDAFKNVKIVRTSNCFWDKDPRVEWYIDQLYKKEKVPVPVFQKRSFMHIEYFAESIEAYCEMFAEMPKILHISGSETVDWYTFMKMFAETQDIPKSLSKKFTKKWFDDNRKARRPKKAGLNVELSAKLGLPQFDYVAGLLWK